MKKPLPMLLALLPFFATAQTDSTKTIKHQKWSVGVQISAAYDNNIPVPTPGFSGGFEYPSQVKNLDEFSLGLQGSYVLHHKYIVQLKAGMHFTSELNYDYDTVVANRVYTVHESMKQSVFYSTLAFGRLAKLRHVWLYGGLEIPFIHYGTFTYTYTNDAVNYGNAATETTNVTVPGGNAIGLGTFTGADFFLCHSFSVGTEVSVSFIYAKTGGTETVHSWSTGYITYDKYDYYVSSRQRLYISTVRPSINLSFHF